MNLIERLAFRAGRLAASVRHGARLSVRNEAPAYEAGSTGTRRTSSWYAPSASVNSAILGSLETLRQRSRAGVRNDGVAKAVINRLTSNLVGTGIRPLSKAPDREFQRAVQMLWARWTLQSDPEGLLSFYGQQSLATRAWLEAGEAFARLRDRLPEDGLVVPLQVQIIEPELCPLTHNAVNGSNRVRAGVEFSPIGKRVAYWMYRQRPGDLQDMDTTQLVRIDAAGVIPLFDVLRPGQIRGLPHLTQALLRLHELDQYDDAVLVRQKLANLFAGFVRSPATTSLNGEQLDPVTGQVIQRDSGDRPEISLEPGIIRELAPGEEISFAEPPDAGDGYTDFMRAQLRAAAIAADVPYEVLTGDMTGVNDRTVRVILNEFRRRLEQIQAQLLVDRLCRPVWEAWFDRAVVSGALLIPGGAAAYNRDRDTWRAAEWKGQRHKYIQPLQDVEAQRDEIRVGLTSLSAMIAERGEDPDDVLEQIAADNERLDKLGLVLDSDPRKTSRAGQATTSSGNESGGSDDGDGGAEPAPRPSWMKSGRARGG